MNELRRRIRLHDPAAVARARSKLLPASADPIWRPLSTAMCDPVRLKIVQALSGADLTVKDLAAVLGRSQSTTSQHLRVLREGGLVAARRYGRRVVYGLPTNEMGGAMRSLLGTLERVAS